MGKSKSILVLILVLVAGRAIAQVNTSDLKLRGRDTVNFKYESIVDPKADYPVLEWNGYEEIVQIATIQGIRVSFAVDIDRYNEAFDFDVYTSDDFYITVYLDNMTGEDIYYDNPDDIVADIHFPGNETYFDNVGGKEQHIMGGRTPFYAAFLEDKENGKYVLRAGEQYEWDYNIFREAETLIQMAAQREFRPLSVTTHIPQIKVGKKGFINDYISYKETIEGEKQTSEITDGYNRTTVHLPKRHVHLTSFAPKVKSLEGFKKNGDYDVIYESKVFILELKNDGDGWHTYKVTNKTPSEIKAYNDGYFAELYFVGKGKTKLWLHDDSEKHNVKNNWTHQVLPPHGSYTGRFQVSLTPVSGEYWVNGDKLEFRKKYERSYVPRKLVIRPFQGAAVAESSGSDEMAIHVLFPGKKSNAAFVYGAGYLYTSATEYIPISRGNIYKFTTANEGVKNLCIIEYKNPYPEKLMYKYFNDQGLYKGYVLHLDIQPGEAYYYVFNESDSKLSPVTKEQWETFINDPGYTKNKEPEVHNLTY